MSHAKRAYVSRSEAEEAQGGPRPDQRRFTRFNLDDVVGKIAFERDGRRHDVDVTVMDMSIGGLLIGCPRGTIVPPVEAALVVSIRASKDWTPPLTCRVARTFLGENGAPCIGVRFVDTGRDEDSVTRCALLSVAMLRTSTISLLGDELRQCASLIANASIGHAELTTALARHPRLQEHLIQLASSPLYLGRPVADVMHAARVLGFQAAVNAALVFIVAQMVPPYDASDRTHWIRALAGAHLAERARGLARTEIREKTGDPFAASLLRDLGALVLRRAFPLEVARLDESREFAGSPCELEQAAFGLTHEHVNGILCQAASVPDEVAQAMSAHHRLPSDASPMASLVHLVDAVVEQRANVSPTALRVLGITPKAIDVLRSALPDAMRLAAPWFESLIEGPIRPALAADESGAHRLDLRMQASERPPVDVDIPPVSAPMPIARRPPLPVAAAVIAPSSTDERLAAFRRVRHVLASTAPPSCAIDGAEASARATRALEAWPEIRRHLEAPERSLPAVLLVEALQLNDRALATLFVAGVSRSLELTAMAGEICEDLAIAAAPLARRGLLDAGLLAQARQAMQHNHADALEALVTLFESSWEKVNGFTVVSEEELARANQVARTIRASNDAAAFAADIQSIKDALPRAVAALDSSYDECRRALTYLRWAEGDADAIAPPLARE